MSSYSVTLHTSSGTQTIEVADDVTLAHHYVLDNADVIDENGNGIADDAEDL